MLVLAVAGGAWVLFGQDSSTKKSTTAIGPKVATAAPHAPVIGPVVPGSTPKAAPTKPTAIGPVAAPTKAAATTPPKATPAPAVAPTKAPVAAPTTPPVAKPPAVKPVAVPPVTAPQVGGTVAKKAYTFKIARGDTLWQLASQTLSSTGRSMSNANVAAYVAKLYQSNHGVIGYNPNLIVPGQTIVWPAGL